MRFLIVLLFCAIAICECKEIDDNNLEDLDLGKFLTSEDQMKKIFKCLMDQGPCDNMEALRSTIPILIETQCSQCSRKQKEKFNQVTQTLSTKYPKQFQALVDKYSPRYD